MTVHRKRLLLPSCTSVLQHTDTTCANTVFTCGIYSVCLKAPSLPLSDDGALPRYSQYHNHCYSWELERRNELWVSITHVERQQQPGGFAWYLLSLISMSSLLCSVFFFLPFLLSPTESIIWRWREELSWDLNYPWAVQVLEHHRHCGNPASPKLLIEQAHISNSGVFYKDSPIF